MRGRLVGFTINSFDGKGGLSISPADSKKLVLGGVKTLCGSSKIESPLTGSGRGDGEELSRPDVLLDDTLAPSPASGLRV